MSAEQKAVAHMAHLQWTGYEDEATDAEKEDAARHALGELSRCVRLITAVLPAPDEDEHGTVFSAPHYGLGVLLKFLPEELQSHLAEQAGEVVQEYYYESLTDMWDDYPNNDLDVNGL